MKSCIQLLSFSLLSVRFIHVSAYNMITVFEMNKSTRQDQEIELLADSDSQSSGPGPWSSWEISQEERTLEESSLVPLPHSLAHWTLSVPGVVRALRTQR